MAYLRDYNYIRFFSVFFFYLYIAKKLEISFLIENIHDSNIKKFFSIPSRNTFEMLREV